MQIQKNLVKIGRKINKNGLVAVKSYRMDLLICRLVLANVNILYGSCVFFELTSKVKGNIPYVFECVVFMHFVRVDSVPNDSFFSYFRVKMDRAL